MRHKVAGYKLGRNTSHRRSLLRNLVTSVIVEERIETTVPKAKAARPIVEKMITLGKRGDLAARRQALAYLMMGLMVIFMAVTGFAMHTGWLHSSFAWVNPMLGGVMITRILHFFGMWVFIILSSVHLYFGLRQELLDKDRTMLSMVDGYKEVEAKE